jgi:outer membrane protein OmpA-like peptidoglycan-associated protein
MSPWKLVFAAVLCLPSAVAAQTDAAGCKDHPLFNRMPDHYIARCEQSPFEMRRFPIGPATDSKPPKLVEVEGQWTAIAYRPAEGGTKASPLQIQRNFENAAKAAGGTVEGSYPAWCKVYLDESFKLGNSCTGNGSTLKFTRDGKEAWVFVNATAMPYTGYHDGYAVMILERAAMSQDIVANDLLAAINKDGMVPLYLNFETGSATLQASSNSQIDQIAAMLKANATLSLEIAGHTDNAGAVDANQALSDARAAAVMKALTDRGIPAARLTAKGYGQTQPIADNRTESGRAKNRRVELVKR